MEIVISLGIISVTVVSLFGILAQAMSGAHQAAGRTIGSEIGARLIGEMQLKDWPTLISEETSYRYFDEFGEEKNDPDGSQTSAFTALASIEEEGPTFSTVNISSNSHCRKITVIVADSPGVSGEQSIENFLSNAESIRNLHFFKSYVVNMDK